MLKNSLYPYVEKYINKYLYGFTKEQLEVGVMSGKIGLENLNLRPDKVNEKLDDKNQPFWLKAGLISKISVTASIMNIIGEKPLNVVIDGIDVILTPSYKWIIKNLNSFVEENKIHIKEPYDQKENNSYDIFQKKVNVFDNSIFSKEKIIEIFKDKSKVSNMINKMFKKFLKFYYMKNFSVIATIKNIHIRFEDDQLINFIGDIALGFKIDIFEITLSSEGIMKKNSFKLQKFDVYWESNAKILIPSDTLNNSFDQEGKLLESYYTMLKKLNFGKFSYLKDTQFLVRDFNCKGNFGTQSLDQGNIDLFNKREKNFRMYIQYASSELNINLFPDLFIIFNNFKKFIREFSVLEQVQEFKPMKKPYNKNNPNVKEMLEYTKKNKNSQLTKIFLHKKKMLVRDWFYYFYWCKNCNNSIYNKSINPLRLEFSRFFNLCFTEIDLNSINGDKNKDNKSVSTIGNTNNIYQGSKPTEDNPNPDNIILSFSGEFLIKGVNININPSIIRKVKESSIIKISGIEIKLNISREKFIMNFGIKNIGFGPNNLIIGERVTLSNEYSKRHKNNMINNNNNNTINNQNLRKSSMLINKPEEDGISKLIKKYNPQYEKNLKVMNEAFNKIDDQNKTKRNDEHNNTNKNNMNKNQNILRGKTPDNNNKTPIEKNSFLNAFIKGNNSFNPALEKIELNKEKNNFSVSQLINSFNNNKIKQPQNQPLKSKGISLKSENGPKEKLNLLEITSQTQNYCFSINYIKTNDNSPDNIKVNFGTIRLNLFSSYVSTCLSIISEYQNYMKQPQMKSPIKVSTGLKLQKQLYSMKKYIYQYLINLPNEKKNEPIKKYIEYLKDEIQKAEKLMEDENNFEVNYLFSLFAKGFEIYFNYENFECIYYNNDKGKNRVLGKAIIPEIDLNFKLTSSLIYVKLFDFEFEINDLGNTKFLLNTLMKIMEDKLKTTKIFIEPCLIQMKAEMENNKTINSIIPLKEEFNFQVEKKSNNDEQKIIEDNRGITKTIQDNESEEGNLNIKIKEDDNINSLDINFNQN